MKDVIKECRGCGASTLTALIELRDMPIGSHFSVLPNTERIYPIGLMGCNKCDLVQLKHNVLPRLIFGFDVDRAIQAISKTLGANQIGLAKKRKVLQIGGLSNREVEESVNGEISLISLEAVLVRMAAEQEAPVESLEEKFSESAIHELLSRYGKVDEIQITNTSKGVHPLHLSNVSNIPRYLSKILYLLKKNGKVFIRYPSLDQIVKHNQIGYIYHEHQSYFDRESLTRVMAKFDLDLISEHAAQDNLNLEVVFQKRGGSEPKPQWVDDRNQAPEYVCNNRLNDFRMIEDRLRLARERLSESLSLVESGRFSGYGASVAGVTTMYQLGLDRKLDFLIDDNERKVGLFSPANNLPVLLSKGLQPMKLDCTVILVPRFEKRIRRNHPENLGNLQTTSLFGILREDH